eukprot:1870598-Prymnesium_polylepis.2
MPLSNGRKRRSSCLAAFASSSSSESSSSESASSPPPCALMSTGTYLPGPSSSAGAMPLLNSRFMDSM